MLTGGTCAGEQGQGQGARRRAGDGKEVSGGPGPTGSELDTQSVSPPSRPVSPAVTVAGNRHTSLSLWDVMRHLKFHS